MGENASLRNRVPDKLLVSEMLEDEGGFKAPICKPISLLNKPCVYDINNEKYLY